jgi:V/A-type H+-transporting ATPase subunit K
MKMQLKGKGALSLLTVLSAVVFAGIAFATPAAYAQEGETPAASDSSFKFLAAGLAFGLAALGAGIGLGFVTTGGLAAISENPKMQSSVFIFVGMVESIAIYGIVMMFIILGQ